MFTSITGGNISNSDWQELAACRGPRATLFYAPVQGERKGKSVDLRGGHLMRISAGKVVEGWGFTDNQDALDDFFSA